MKEWDADAYTRRWKGTHGFYTLDKTRHQGTFVDFFTIDRKNHGVLIDPKHGETFRASIECSVVEYPTVSIEYHPIESGWYLHKSGAALLTRKHLKGFQVGLSSYNHLLSVYDEKGAPRAVDAVKFALCDFTQRPKFGPYTPGEHFGILNERLWWCGANLMFLKRCIGMFKTPEALVLDQKELVPFIQPYLGEACQISY